MIEKKTTKKIIQEWLNKGKSFNHYEVVRVEDEIDFYEFLLEQNAIGDFDLEGILKKRLNELSQSSGDDEE